MITPIKAVRKGSPARSSQPGKARHSVRAGAQTKKNGTQEVTGFGTEIPGAPWELRLYVAGQTAKSVTAFINLKKICSEHIAGKYHIEVIDLLKNPMLAKGDQILAVPTLVRKLPSPIRKILGDLSNTERVLVGLDLRDLTYILHESRSYCETIQGHGPTRWKKLPARITVCDFM